MSDPLKEKAELEEKRRITFYRQVGKLENWEKSLIALRNHARNGAVSDLHNGKDSASHYHNGKADAIEELMEKIRISTTIPE